MADDLEKELENFVSDAPAVKDEAEDKEEIADDTATGDEGTGDTGESGDEKDDKTAVGDSDQSGDDADDVGSSDDGGDLEVDQLTEREKKLLARIEELTGKHLSVDEAVAVAQAEVKKEPLKEEGKEIIKEPPTDEVDFLAGQSLDDILDDPKKFNALLMKVYKLGQEGAITKSTERVLTSIPKLVTQYVGKQATMTNLVNDFYKKNPDLAAVKKTVAAVANDVAAENPGFTVEQVFESVAKKTREVLGMKERVTPQRKDAKKPDLKKPAFADQKGRKVAPNSGLKGLEKEINDLLL